LDIAFLVESQENGVSAQTLVLPHKGKVKVFHRLSTGQAGRAESWKDTEDTSALPDTLLSFEPVGVIITERDLALVDTGLVTNIGAKALYALQSAEVPQVAITHKEAVDSIINALYEGDSTITRYITDKRRNSEIKLHPLRKPAQVTEENSAPTEKELQYAQMISVPDPKWAKEYISRHFEGGIKDFEVYDYALANQINVLIEGGAGSGKTMSVIAYASERKYRYFNVSSNAGIDPSQLFGRWVPSESGGFRWQDGAITLLVRYGGVLLLNEVNFMPERIMTVLYSLLDDRREIQLLDNGNEVIKAHPDLLIVADMNQGYRGTHELSQANNDRWKVKLEFPYDKKIEAKLITSKALLELVKKLRDQFDLDEITTPISTRGIVAFQKNVLGVNLDFAITSYVNGFAKNERESVRKSIEAYRTQIERELLPHTVKQPTQTETQEHVGTSAGLTAESLREAVRTGTWNV